MNIESIKHIYFIGIGGIGMSAIARYFHTRGVMVSGYDKTQTPLTIELENEGMNIHYEENLNLIPKEIDVVVYTPAIPANHAELIFYQENNFVVMKRSDMLQHLTNQSNVIGVAGTHGKTTTSTMIAHVLKHTGFDCTAFLGGISANYNSNFLIGKNNWMVVEADEYDRSFLKLFPQIAVITAVDPDHLDIYKGGVADFENTFIEFVSQVKTDGRVFIKKPLAIQNKFKHPHIFTYGIATSDADLRTENIVYKNGTYFFDVVFQNKKIDTFELNVHGTYNIENALAAIGVALQLGISFEKIKSAVASFAGVKRRFEYIIKNANCIYIDDYAHHPNEIKPFLQSVKAIYPDKKITTIFQPHLFSRTKDFAEGFSESLSYCDELILIPIYPAREKPMPGVSSEMLLEKISITNKKVIAKENVLDYINTHRPEVLCTIGAGDIDTLIEPLKKLLS